MRIFYVPEHIDPKYFVGSMQNSITAQALNSVTSNIEECGLLGCDAVWLM
jgi:hypothetical protein